MKKHSRLSCIRISDSRYILRLLLDINNASALRYPVSSEYVLGTPSLYAAGDLQVRLDVDEANDSTLTFTDKE